MMRRMSAPAPAAVAPRPRFSNAYELFILVLTVLSLVIMLGLVARRTNAATTALLNAYDNAICLVFIGDFIARLRRAPSKRGYFISERGWLDLIGSIPSFGFLGDGGRWASLFRLARISRLARITRLLHTQGKHEILDDVREHRGQYAVVITLTAAMIVLIFASVFVVQFEATAPNGNIKTGGEALWWAIVTLTTVGYGDYFPVTAPGRITGVFVMVTGIGIIGALASIFASLLVSTDDDEPTDTASAGEMRALHDEIAALRRELAAREGPP
jgi:voltage-gated potassium channel